MHRQDRLEVDVDQHGEPLREELAEIRRFERKNDELWRANEMLKLASAYFAQELDPVRPLVLSALHDSSGGTRRGGRCGTQCRPSSRR